MMHRDRLRIAAAIGAGSLLAGCVALPHEGAPVTAQRTAFASDTATAPEGSFELEAGVAVGPATDFDTPLQLKYGAGSSTEAFLQLSPWKRLDEPGDDAEGFGDLIAGSRHRFIEAEGTHPSAALQAQVRLPTADEDQGLGTGEVDLALAGILTWHLDHHALSALYQIDRLGDPEGGADAGHHPALLAAWLPRGRLGAFAEIAGSFVPDQDYDAVFATVGATYNPAGWLVWDLSLLVGLTDDAPDWQIGFGFTQNLGRVRPAR